MDLTPQNLSLCDLSKNASIDIAFLIIKKNLGIIKTHYLHNKQKKDFFYVKYF